MSDSRARSRSILVFRVGLLGDTLVALPAIEAIRERFPHHALVLLTSRPADPGWVSTWDVLRETGWFEEVICYEPAPRSAASLAALARMALALRRARFDHVFALAPLRHPWQTRRDSAKRRRASKCAAQAFQSRCTRTSATS